MTKRELSTSMKSKTIGDAAIDGLLGGIGAGLAMVLLLVIVVAMGGGSPAAVMERFDPLGSYNVVTGTLAHLAVSAIYGALFGLLFLVLIRLRPSLLRFGSLAGLVYGLLLYAIARSAFLTGIDSGLAYYSTPVLLLSHALYGLVTGTVIGRKWD